MLGGGASWVSNTTHKGRRSCDFMGLDVQLLSRVTDRRCNKLEALILHCFAKLDFG